MPARKKTPVLERMAADLARRTPGRSPLTIWLNENRTGFAALIDQYGARWDVLAAILKDEGVLNIKAGDPTGETLRGAWRRVQQRHERPVKGAKTKPPPAPVKVLAPAQPQPVSQPSQHAARTGSRADEQLARMDEKLKARKGRMPTPL